MSEISDNQLMNLPTLSCIEACCQSIRHELGTYDTKINKEEALKIERAYSILLEVSESYVHGKKG